MTYIRTHAIATTHEYATSNYAFVCAHTAFITKQKITAIR